MALATLPLPGGRSRAGSRRTRRLSPRASATIWGGLLVLLVALGVVVPLVTGFSPTAQNPAEQLLPPSLAHPFGTDELGRDVAQRVFYAARVDIPLALLAVAIPGIVGVVLGLVAGSGRRVADNLVMRVADVAQSFPGYVLMIVIAFIVGPGALSFLVALAAVNWVSYARITRSQLLVLREMDFMHAAKLAGFGRARLMGRHVLPNAMPQLISFVPSDATYAIVTLASVSFLGLGIQQPTPEWGLMISTSRLYLANAWWLSVFPGLFILVTAAAFAFLSDALDDWLRR